VKIGIGITTTSSRPLWEQTAAKIIEHTPGIHKLSIVKDVSGIARAKNKNLAELDECDHIFLFDDDCWPIVDNWHMEYINYGVLHMSFTFSKLADGRANGNRVMVSPGIYQNPCGCMLYISRSVLYLVGGFDERFAGWGYEHVNYSRRVFNAGLTPFPYMDVPHSLKLFHSMDYYQEVKSSVPGSERIKHLKANRDLFEKEMNNAYYCSYK